MWCSSKTKTRRLLCVLFLRFGPMSAGPGQTGRCAAVTAHASRRPGPSIIGLARDDDVLPAFRQRWSLATVAPARQMALRLLSIECHCHAALWAQAPHTNARNGWLGRGTGLGRTGLPNVEHKKARRKGDDVRSLLGRDLHWYRWHLGLAVLR